MTSVSTPVGRRHPLSIRADRDLPVWWPLAVVVFGYPLWWLIGIASIMPMLMSIVMARQLWRSRPILLPRGFAFWVLFLVWVPLGALTLWVDAPGAVPGGDITRLVPFAYRLAWYLTVTIVLLWTANVSRKEVPFAKVASIFAWMFVITSFGGLLGVIAPELELRSLVETVLPAGLRSNSFVRSLIHPAVADIQRVLGRPEARPKAPFPFANTWGAVLALSLPFFLVAWVKNGTRGQRLLVPVVLVVAAIPTVYSLNRGLWACLAVGVVFLAVVQGWRGRPMHLLAMLIVGVVAVGALALSPLGTVIGERFDNQHSNDRRGELLTKTVTAATTASPVVGFGSTRDVQGSFASIAGGGTPSCPACEVPPLGTQGQLWLVIFSQGLVGAAFFLLFFGSSFLGSIRCRTQPEIVATALLLFFGLQLFVYDTLGMPLYMIMAAIGLAWREGSRRQGSEAVVFRVLTLREFVERVRAHQKWWIVAPVVGMVVGVGIAAAQPQRYAATYSVLLAAPPSHLAFSTTSVRAPREITVDTEAGLVMAERTMASALGDDDPSQAEKLRRKVRVTAIANTRIIQIRVAEDSASAAAEMASRVSSAYLDTRREYLDQRRDQYLMQLRERYTQLVTLGGEQGRNLSRDQRDELDYLNQAIGDVVLTPTQAGETIRQGVAVRAGEAVPAWNGVGGRLGHPCRRHRHGARDGAESATRR